jgi:transposase-like protein
MDMVDMEEEDQHDDITEDSESDALVTDAVGNKIAKIAELQKKKRQITAQYTRVLKQWDGNICKHTQVLQNKNILFDGSKKLHKRPKCPSCGLNSNL